jgi:iron complex transport system substrate-binding protein
MRICSLLPSATEIVAALGLADSLVGVSEECDWPPEVRGLPVVSASRVDTRSISGVKIEHEVRAALSDGRPLYALDAELLESLQPDLILTQDLCAVCAVSSADVNALCATSAEVLAVDAHTLDQVAEGMLRLAHVLGVPGNGSAAVAAMHAKMDAVAAQVKAARKRPVCVAEWLEPPYAAGHWIPEMVAVAGGREVLGSAGAPSYPTSWDVIRERAPELIVAAPCGYDHVRTAREAALPPLGCRVVAVDANAYYARPAPRLADGVAQLAHLIHPELVEDPGLPYTELDGRGRGRARTR